MSTLENSDPVWQSSSRASAQSVAQCVHAKWASINPASNMVEVGGDFRILVPEPIGHGVLAMADVQPNASGAVVSVFKRSTAFGLNGYIDAAKPCAKVKV
jgi:hypothetical protein